jgi:hypothetical protein
MSAAFFEVELYDKGLGPKPQNAIICHARPAGDEGRDPSSDRTMDLQLRRAPVYRGGYPDERAVSAGFDNHM